MGLKPSLSLLKVGHHGACKFTKEDRRSKCDPESHTNGVVVDMVIEVLFGLVYRAIGE